MTGLRTVLFVLLASGYVEAVAVAHFDAGLDAAEDTGASIDEAADDAALAADETLAMDGADDATPKTAVQAKPRRIIKPVNVHTPHTVKAVKPNATVQGFLGVKRKNGLKCYVNQDFATPLDAEPVECQENEDRCLVRVAVSERPGQQSVVEAHRYCSSSALCYPHLAEAAGTWVSQLDTRNMIRKHEMCCETNECNGGVPALLGPGLYWIRPYNNEQKFLTWNEASNDFTMEDFLNTEAQKFRVTISEEIAGIPSTYAIVPQDVYRIYQGSSELETEVAAFTQKTWKLYETDFWTYQIREQLAGEQSPEAPLVQMEDQTFPAAILQQFSLTPTLYHWKVGLVGERCPERLLEAQIRDAEKCKEACLKNNACMQTKMIEFDVVQEKCYLVIAPCGSDDVTAADTTLYRYESPCNSVSCAAIHQCSNDGFCDENTGLCSSGGPKDIGLPCNDNNPTTMNDVCTTEGLCEGEDLCEGVVCEASACHFLAESCDPAFVNGCERTSGLCVSQISADGTQCDDGSGVTVNDVCTGGQCAGQDLCYHHECAPQDTCHTVGVCDHNMGPPCPQTAKADNEPCDDDNEDTEDDKCLAGVCTGTVDNCRDVVCAAASSCHEAGTCDSATGMCSNPTKSRGSPCDDLSIATTEDQCDGSGVCAGTDPCPVCERRISGSCRNAGYCSHQTGFRCFQPNLADGTSCLADGTSGRLRAAFHQTGNCKNGECVKTPLNPVVSQIHGGDWKEAYCPASYSIIGGGCDAYASPHRFEASHPESTWKWKCGGHGGPKNVYAICSNSHTPTIRIADGGDWTVAYCQGGQKVIGGGCAANNWPHKFQASRPHRDYGWKCGGHGGRKKAYAICLSSYSPRYKSVQGGDWTTVTCDSGKKVIAGGCDATGSPHTFQTSRPIGTTAWQCGGHGGAKTVWAICTE